MEEAYEGKNLKAPVSNMLFFKNFNWSWQDLSLLVKQRLAESEIVM